MSKKKRLFRQLSAKLRTRSRQRRFGYFWRNVGQYANTGIWLDLGGGEGSLFLTEINTIRPAILLDMNHAQMKNAQAKHLNILAVLANGEHLPFKDLSIACIFCNSVIEHVQHPAELSAEIARVGQSYFVQTPNGSFPLETHSFIPIPFYRLMPERFRRMLCRLIGASYGYIESVSYISEQQLKAMYPDATHRQERWLGLVKAFYVLKQWSIDKS